MLGSGILLLDKPEAHTSFDVVARMRGIAKTRKIGHGGTLDPMATGVLPLFIGKATKACDLLPDQDKRYTAAFRLGQTTDTQDSTGALLRERPVTATAETVTKALTGFVGTQQQTPPMYSAVKSGGKRLYELARKGLEVERPSREITIHSLTLLSADEERHQYVIDVACSKGTYIRTLCHDLGESLSCGAVLTGLRRTRACGFSIEDCVTLDEARERSERGSLEELLLPVETAFASLPRLDLSPALAGHFRNGVSLWLTQLDAKTEDTYRAFEAGGAFLGLARPDFSTGQLRIVKFFG